MSPPELVQDLMKLLLVAGVVAVVVAGWRESRVWREIHISYRDTSPTVGRYAYLRQQGVRCRLSNRSTGRPLATPWAVLLVHRNDLPRARQLLAQQFPNDP